MHRSPARERKKRVKNQLILNNNGCLYPHCLSDTFLESHRKLCHLSCLPDRGFFFPFFIKQRIKINNSTPCGVSNCSLTCQQRVIKSFAKLSVDG